MLKEHKMHPNIGRRYLPSFSNFSGSLLTRPTNCSSDVIPGNRILATLLSLVSTNCTSSSVVAVFTNSSYSGP